MNTFNVCCVLHTEVVLLEDPITGDVSCPECVFEGVPNLYNSETNSDEEEYSPVFAEGNPYYRFPSYGTGLKLISDMSANLHLPDNTMEYAKLILYKLYNVQGIRVPRFTYDCKAAAALYLACRLQDIPRTFNEMCAVSGVNKWQIGKCHKFLTKMLKKFPGVVDCKNYINRFCNLLELPKYLISAIYCVTNRAKDMKCIYGKCPISIAAAAIYMVSQVSNELRTTEEVASVAGVCSFTVRSTYRLMLPHAATLFPSNFKFITALDDLPDIQL